MYKSLVPFRTNTHAPSTIRILQFLYISCVFLFLFCMSITLPVSAKSAKYNILCISSYSISNQTVSEQTKGIIDGLDNLSYSIDYEFMDSATYYSPADIATFQDYLTYKLNNGEEFDLIFLCDDNALRFWYNNREKLFGETPVIFLGINNIDDAESAAALPYVTGVAEIPDYIGTFELMHQLFPERKNVVAVVDGSYTGRGEYTQFQKYSSQYDEFTYQTILTDDYSGSGLKDALAKIDENSMILHLDFSHDADGNNYTEEAASRLLYENAKNVPIFRTTSPNLGFGTLGGKMYSFYEAGITAGKMAVSVLSKEESIHSIPIVLDPVTEYMFDYKIMEEYGIREKDLPEDSTIINEPFNLIKFYKTNTTICNLILVVILLLIGFIGLLSFANRRRTQIINTDFLTQMPNRLFIQSRVNSVLDKRQPCGILMMDVDHFKSINDTLGHGIGDELLIEVAARLKAMSTPRLIFARIGGDEFMALITGDALSDVNAICEKLVKTIADTYRLSSGTIQITASIGVAVYPDACDDPKQLQADADIALYHVKENGRNGYCIFSDHLEKHPGP